MIEASRFKLAALMTTLFVGGAAAGVALRDGSSPSATSPSAAALPPKVIHRRTVRTVHAHPNGHATGASAVSTPVATPVASAGPSPVTSSTSGGGGGVGAGGGGDGGERESGD